MNSNSLLIAATATACIGAGLILLACCVPEGSNNNNGNTTCGFTRSYSIDDGVRVRTTTHHYTPTPSVTTAIVYPGIINNPRPVVPQPMGRTHQFDGGNQSRVINPPPMGTR